MNEPQVQRSCRTNVKFPSTFCVRLIMCDPRDVSTVGCVCYIKCGVAIGLIVLAVGLCCVHVVIYCLIIDHVLVASCFGFLGTLLILTSLFMLMDSYNAWKYETLRQHQRAVALREQRENALRGQRELALMVYRRQREIDLVAERFQNQDGLHQERLEIRPILINHESVDEGYSHSPLNASDESNVDANPVNDNVGRENFQNLSNRNSENDNTDQSYSSEHGQWL